MKTMIQMSTALCLALLLGACGGGELDLYGCRSDADCKHGRVCVDGECQGDAGGCRSDEDCPAGQHCYDLSCVVCDADGDGSFGSQCAGDDCDDGDPAVNPDARELCGDGLDNDCDGATDPHELCDEKCDGVECPEGWACDPDTGDCVPICTPHCSGRECGPDGCGGDCGVCPPGLTCDRDGNCVAGCQDRCDRGETACVGNQVTTCRDTDGDGCVEWSEPVPCAPDESCLEGRCVECESDCTGRTCGPDPECGVSCGECPEWLFCDDGWCVEECRDECWVDGESYCIDEWTSTVCGDWDQDWCLEFGPPLPCEEGYCDQATGRCGGACFDECDWWGESFCWDEYGYVECGDWDGDGCLEFSERIPCAEGERCDWEIGRCGGGCRDECWWGESYCIDEWAFVECGDWDDDWCLEFGPPMQCPPNEPCEEGRCGGCWDECWWGETFCWDEYGYVECGQWDEDQCLEFSPRLPCPDNTICNWETGRCDEPCLDECRWGEFYCLGERRYMACGQYDMDPCAEWGPEQRCPQGTVCSEDMGGCVEENCRDECMPGEHFCWDPWSFVECGNYDPDPCLEFGPPFPCPPDAPCDWQTGWCGVCEPWTCWELGFECGWWEDGCGDEMYCGNCQSGQYCNAQGRCQAQGGREGAGQPCGLWQACPADWSAAWTCVEFPSNTEGICSYPCDSDSDCAVDFPDGCCRELIAGYSVCLPDPDLCSFQGSGYLEDCQWSSGNLSCLPDMFCIEGYMDTGENACLFTCDRAMGVCPTGGQCIPLDEGSATGFCLPTGDGVFGDPCDLYDGCVSGLLCTPLDEEHPGYCNTMCSGFLPCPNGFECILQDGEGGMWCAELCEIDSDCARLGDWECVYAWGPDIGLCLPRP